MRSERLGDDATGGRLLHHTQVAVWQDSIISVRKFEFHLRHMSATVTQHLMGLDHCGNLNFIVHCRVEIGSRLDSKMSRFFRVKPIDHGQSPEYTCPIAPEIRISGAHSRCQNFSGRVNARQMIKTC